MFKKNKTEASNVKASIKNTIALKRNVYAIILSVIFIAVVIGLTALSTVFAERYPLDIDLTTNKQHSISGKNFEYISSIDKKINIYVSMTEEQYKGQTNTTADMAYFAANQYFVEYGSGNMVYYNQTVELLKKYQDYNDNIAVQFIDVYDVKSREIIDNFADFDYQLGDILVESTFKLNGEDVTRRAIVLFNDVYKLDTDTNENANYLTSSQGQMGQLYGLTATAGMGYGYNIIENNIESAISSAIYRVTSPDTPVFLVPTTITNKEAVAESLEKILEINNIDVEYNDQLLSTVLTPESFGKYAGIILADCKSDITVGERALLESFLHNGGKKQKSLYYFAGTNTTSLKNLCGLLGDWGIGFGEGILYETDADFHGSDKPTQIIVETVQTDYTKGTAETKKYCFLDNMVYMKQLWPTSSTATYTRATHVIMRTASFAKTALMPLGANKDWKPANDAQTFKFPTGIFAYDEEIYEKKYVRSHVVAFASTNVISDDYNQNNVANMDITLTTFKQAVGTADSAFSFVPKTIKIEDYSSNVNEKKVRTMKWIFMGAVPVAVIATGVAVWVRRKRK